MANITYVATHEDTNNNTTYSVTGVSVGADISPLTKKLVIWVVTATSSATRAFSNATMDGTSISGGHIYDGGSSGRFAGIFIREVAPDKTTADFSVTFDGGMTNCTISVLFADTYNSVPNLGTDIATNSPGSGSDPLSITLSSPHAQAKMVAAVVNRTTATWSWATNTGTASERYDNAVESQSRSVATISAGGTGDHIIQATPSSSSTTRVMIGLVINHLAQTLSVSAEKGTFTLSGVDAALREGTAMLAAVGNFLLTGNDASRIDGKNLAAAVGSFVYTGVAATLRAIVSFPAAAGEYLLSGKTVRQDFTMLFEPASYILTGLSNIMVRVTVSAKYLKARLAPHRLKGELRNIFLRE